MGGDEPAGGGQPPPPFFATPPAQAGRIRQAEVADAAALRQLMANLNRDQGDPDHLLGEDHVARDIIADAGTVAIVAEAADGSLVGFATAHPTYESGHAERGLYVGDLYVAPDHRRQGIARALLAAIARAGHARGARHLWLTARQENAAAHAFYRRLGSRGETVVAFAVVGQDFSNLAAEQPR